MATSNDVKQYANSATMPTNVAFQQGMNKNLLNSNGKPGLLGVTNSTVAPVSTAYVAGLVGGKDESGYLGGQSRSNFSKYADNNVNGTIGQINQQKFTPYNLKPGSATNLFQPYENTPRFSSDSSSLATGKSNSTESMAGASWFSDSGASKKDASWFDKTMGAVFGKAATQDGGSQAGVLPATVQAQDQAVAGKISADGLSPWEKTQLAQMQENSNTQLWAASITAGVQGIAAWYTARENQKAQAEQAEKQRAHDSAMLDKRFALERKALQEQISSTGRRKSAGKGDGSQAKGVKVGKVQRV